MLSVACSLVAATSFAQNVIYDNGTTKVYENGVVYSRGGFKTITIENKDVREYLGIPDNAWGSCTSTGLYSSDGKVYIRFQEGTENVVEKGTEFIAKNAFNTSENIYIFQKQLNI